jgi:hypothetical protein
MGVRAVALKKGEKRLFVVLGVFIVIFLVDQFILSSDKSEKAAPSVKLKDKGTQMVKSVLEASPDAGAAVASLGTLPDKKHFDDWGRDPFTGSKPQSVARTGSRSEKKKVEVKKPELQGFFWKQGKAYVLVDKIILTEGEEKEGLRIDKIQDKEVLCSKGGHTFTLYWRESP